MVPTQTTDEDLILKVLAALFRIKRDTAYTPYIPFRDLFKRRNPYVLIKSGRQVSKTTTTVILDIIDCICIPSFYTLVVFPLEVQARRTSAEFFSSILELSNISKYMSFSASSLRYKFANGSTIELSYSSTSKESEDVRRIRGIPADKIHFDEVQDIPHRVIPPILECLSASKYRFLSFTGTPKTLNNTLQILWEDTNCCEWCIPCENCGHKNICSTEQDLLKIIGPYREDISYEKPATICAKCSRIIYPQNGYWVPAFPSRDKLGYHIPQPIIEIHYSNPKNWKDLLDKQALKGGYTVADFYREVLGEAYDIASKLVPLSSLLKCATLGSRDKNFQELRQFPNKYRFTTMGIDWGGGGEQGNYTTIAIAGLCDDGTIEIPWAYESPTPHDHIGEAKLIASLLSELRPNIIVHDYSGAGALRETILLQNGVPFNQIIPVRYVGNQGAALRIIPSTEQHPRTLVQIDSNKCMLYVIGMINQERIRFFNDYEEPNSLIRQFLSLIDETSGKGLIDRYRIGPEPGQRDEFPQAVMLACIGIWLNFDFPKFSL